MSCIIDFAETSTYTTNVLNGFDIVGLEKSESMLNTTENETIVNGTVNDLMENTANFDFINHEIEEQGTLISVDSNVSAEAIDIIESIDSEQLVGEISSEDVFTLEFFNDRVNIISNYTEQENKIFIQGVGNNTEIEYDEITGTFSIDGQEIAQIEPRSELNNNNYEIF